MSEVPLWWYHPRRKRGGVEVRIEASGQVGSSEVAVTGFEARYVFNKYL